MSSRLRSRRFRWSLYCLCVCHLLCHTAPAKQRRTPHVLVHINGGHNNSKGAGSFEILDMLSTIKQQVGSLRPRESPGSSAAKEGDATFCTGDYQFLHELLSIGSYLGMIGITAAGSSTLLYMLVTIKRQVRMTSCAGSLRPRESTGKQRSQGRRHNLCTCRNKDGADSGNFSPDRNLRRDPIPCTPQDTVKHRTCS